MEGGFLNLFSEKEKKQDPGFKSIKEELKKQDLWIKHLHTYSRELHDYTSYINESNTKHKKEIVSEINKISQWISHLHESNNTLKEEVNSLKYELRKQVKEDFAIYHKTLEEYLKLKFLETEEKQEKLKAKIIAELKDIGITNGHNAKNNNTIMHYNEKNDLTNPEKELLNMLFNENKPMTYEDISKKLNKSLNSIRVYMNSLRSKKQIVEEYTTAKGLKVFSIKNSELVKTLFNIK